jgi:hypothetical protein
MARVVTYRDFLRAKGLRPAPAHSKLRVTSKPPGSIELTSTGTVVHGAVDEAA